MIKKDLNNIVELKKQLQHNMMTETLNSNNHISQARYCLKYEFNLYKNLNFYLFIVIGSTQDGSRSLKYRPKIIELRQV